MVAYLQWQTDKKSIMICRMLPFSVTVHNSKFKFQGYVTPLYFTLNVSETNDKRKPRAYSRPLIETDM